MLQKLWFCMTVFSDWLSPCFIHQSKNSDHLTFFHKVSRALLWLHVCANLIGSLDCRVDCGPSSDQESIIFLRDRRPAEKVTEERLKRLVILTRPRVCRLLIPEGRDF